MRNKVYKIISIVLVVLWCILVFYLSAEVADDSSETSGSVIKYILKIIFGNIDQITLESITNNVQGIVRKIAHFVLYTLGGILIYNMVQYFLFSKKQIVILSWLLGICYAFTDEVHQLFVVGRSGELRDVCIDSLGVIFGICIILTMQLVLKNILKNNVDNS